MLHRITLGLTEASIEMGSKIKFHKKIFHKMRNIYVIIVTKASLIHNWRGGRSNEEPSVIKSYVVIHKTLIYDVESL